MPKEHDTGFFDEMAREAASTDITTAPSDDQLSRLQEYGHQVAVLNSECDALGAELKAKQDTLSTMLRVSLPEFMQSIKQDKIGLPDDEVDLELARWYSANIAANWPSERKSEAYDWLVDNGHGDLIKTTLVYTFGREELDLAKSFKNIIEKHARQLGLGELEGQLKMGVHSGTLTSFVKEQTEAGVALPLDLLGAQMGHIVKIKKRKGKK